MYNFNGLYSYVTNQLLLLFFVAIIGLIVSRFWNSEKRNKKLLLLVCVFIVVQIIHLVPIAEAVKEPQLEIFEGEYIRFHNSDDRGAATEYVFDSDTDSDGEKSLYLDTKIRKEMLPEGFLEGIRYRVHYERNTDIIVQIEKLDIEK